jgi:hypothetical protein
MLIGEGDAAAHISALRGGPFGQPLQQSAEKETFFKRLVFNIGSYMCELLLSCLLALKRPFSFQKENDAGRIWARRRNQ